MLLVSIFSSLGLFHVVKKFVMLVLPTVNTNLFLALFVIRIVSRTYCYRFLLKKEPAARKCKKSHSIHVQRNFCKNKQNSKSYGIFFIHENHCDLLRLLSSFYEILSLCLGNILTFHINIIFHSSNPWWWFLWRLCLIF